MSCSSHTREREAEQGTTHDWPACSSNTSADSTSPAAAEHTLPAPHTDTLSAANGWHCDSTIESASLTLNIGHGLLVGVDDSTPHVCSRDERDDIAV